MEVDLNTMKSALTVSQRVAICFAAGVMGGLAVVIFSHVLFRLGVSATLGVKAPVSLKSPDIYKPLFWGGLWGILFGLFIKSAWKRLYLFRSSILPRSAAGTVPVLPADERRGVFRVRRGRCSQFTCCW